MVVAGNLLDCAGGWHPAQGTADPDVRRAYDRQSGNPRPVGRVVLAPASGVGPDLDAGSGAALVRRDLLARRRHVFRGFARRRHVEQAGGAGIPWCTARSLSAAILGDVLAGGAARRNGRPCGLAGKARARRPISARLAGPILDRIRTGTDQAAALRAAAVSSDRDPHGRCTGTARVVEVLV